MSNFVDLNRVFRVEVIENDNHKIFLNARFEWLAQKHFRVISENGDFIDFKDSNFKVKIISMHAYQLIQNRQNSENKN